MLLVHGEYNILNSLSLQAHSVTLSPTPSTESQNGGSPKNAATAVAAALGGGVGGTQSAVTSIHHLFPSPVNANGGGGGARSKLASTSSLTSQVGHHVKRRVLIVFS